MLILVFLIPSEFSTAQNIEYLGSALWSGVNDIDVVGDYAYCAFMNGLVVLDISEPTNPEPVSHLFLEHWAGDIKVTGDIAFICAGNSGILTLDITEPDDPRVIGGYDTPGFAQRIGLSGNYAFVADGYYGLQIIDISNPAAPQYVGSYESGYGYEENFATDIAIADNHAFIAADISFQVIDISDPFNPSLAASVATRAQNIFVSDGFAYVTYEESGLLIFDLSDPENPTLVGTFPSEGTREVYVSGEFAFITNDYEGLQVINVADRTDPYLAGSYNQAIPSFIEISGIYAYVKGASIISTLDISNPPNPLIAGRYHLTSDKQGVFVSGQYAYVASGNSGLQILDVSNTSNPISIGSQDSPDIARDVYVYGDYAYVADYWSGMQIVDVTNPYDPAIIGSYDVWGYAYDVFVHGDLAYIANGINGVEIVDVQDPENPAYWGYFDPPGSAQGVYIQDNYAYVANGSSGLDIADLANSHNPVSIGHCVTPGWAVDVFVRDDYAYVTWFEYTNQGGLVIIAVADPANPTIAGSFSIPRAYQVYVEENYAYVASYTQGLQVLDISDPSNPVSAASYDTPGYSYGVFNAGGCTYLADGYSLIILRFDPETGVIEEVSKPEQNYPNPFNASTIIKYELLEAGDVRIDVYDILGRRVETLAWGRQAAGSHQVTWEGAGMTSGVYFYRITTGNHTSTNKMIMLK